MADVFSVSLQAVSGSTTMFSRKSGNRTSDFDVDGGWSSGTESLLSLLTVIGTSLSIVGVVLAFITYTLFSDLRTVSGTSLLNLLTALFLSHLLSVIGVEKVNDHGLCLTLAFLLHYLWLSLHCWLTVMTRDLFRTFRENVNLQISPLTESRKSFLKCALFAWGFPAALTCLAAFLYSNSGPDSRPLIVSTCWLVDYNTLIYTFELPAAVLAGADLFYFVQSAIVIRYTVSMQMNRRTAEKMRTRRCLQLFLYLKVVVFQIVTWLFCLSAQVTGLFSLWFVFTMLTSLQGFFVAIIYSCNSQVFRLYSTSLKNSRKKKTVDYGSSEVAHSTSLTQLTWSPTPDSV
ncbi:putative adhesion G protein-coupled receptor E4P [Limulus polyphemus]|uniref:Adhesion G protein-coupled receptor E4P n=1 Tax=Limulus polyphemus TaxID=6850 RepID=A0ABM1TIZ7_LIMPO|nr:putative adhesion G protein-coupled receptor E4P [Limulus polyphemus]